MYDELYTINLKSLDKVKEYIDFIESCKGLELPDYTEKHHILPKSLFPKYEFDKDNLIELSAINHYKAHVLLAEAYGGGMLYALRMMDSRYDEEDIPEINYKHFREECSKLRSESMLELWSDPDYKNRVSKSFQKSWKDNTQRKENISAKMTEKWSDPAYKEETSKAIREATQTEEFRNKISDISKAHWQNPEYVSKNNHNRNLVMQTEEYKKKHSDNQKERLKDPAIRAACGWRRGTGKPFRKCVHCGKVGNTKQHFKTHFNNCRIIKDLRASFIRTHLLYLETLNNNELLTKNLNQQHFNKFAIGFKHLKDDNDY